jgi:NADH:ubiquinone oxidoreductase subunit 6 (subunit J)
MPDWLATAVIRTYAGAIVLLVLAAAFSFDADRRASAERVLRLLLPWGFLAWVVERTLHHADAQVVNAWMPGLPDAANLEGISQEQGPSANT